MIDPATRDSAVLMLTGITKRFGTSIAVDGVSLVVKSGTVHALLGENGAGKTTLMRVAFGLVAPDEGQVVAGRSGRRVASPADAIAAGVGMVHQHFTNVAALTVAENVALGGRGRFNPSHAEQRVAEIGVRTGLTLDARARVRDLTVGGQQRLEILKALARDASVLILDEPTAVLAPDEIDDLLRWLRGYADAGNAVILITHKLHEAVAIADDVTVMRRGRVVLSARAADTTVDSLSRSLLGGDAPSPVRPATAARHADEVIAHLEHVSIMEERGATTVRDVSLEVRAGEILGIAAVEGSGQRELLRVLAGRASIVSGSIRIPPSVGFVPEDRHRDALIAEFSITDNVLLRGAGGRRGRIAWPAARLHARRLTSEFDVHGANNERTPASALSGGNQQKLVLARELEGSPRLLVVENPSRGLDIRAARDVHDRLRAVADSGCAVVLYSSDLDEVLAIATRMLVMFAGTVRECARDRDLVGRAMLGVA